MTNIGRLMEKLEMADILFYPKHLHVSRGHSDPFFTNQRRGRRISVSSRSRWLPIVTTLPPKYDSSSSFTGFTCAIDNILVGAGPLDARCTGYEVEAPCPDAQAPSCAILHRIDLRDGRTVVARATLLADGPALRIRWDMPGTVRDERGSPRFTRLGLGPGSLPAARAYLSFGNVIENPRSFSLSAGNFRNLARHAGADYANGASLCQAVDVYPDRIVCRRESNVFAVESCHDATFSLVPSARGAFAAARAFRDVADYARSPAWREAATRMCLDQWGGGYAKTIAGLEKAAKYGVTNAVFVRHGWQRWGFDYRLPEIWPAGGGVEGFLGMAATARRLGMLFAPHDNYIDHYPDAAGFSYDTIVFDADGTPHKAWLNRRKMAQSYRWAPTAFLPALRANAAALRDAFHPDGVFIDVFANLAPWDWYDRAGRFHPRTETAAAWGEAFDEYRRILGGGAVAISEAGHDALVGHLDAGQADHFTAAAWMSSKEYADAERVPWQDIVTHGSFVLYGGGLGWRYASNSAGATPRTATPGAATARRAPAATATSAPPSSAGAPRCATWSRSIRAPSRPGGSSATSPAPSRSPISNPSTSPAPSTASIRSSPTTRRSG